jgi:uncharacterized protein YutE (UPF0331/DUF86 family)
MIMDKDGVLDHLAGFRNVLVHIYWKLDMDEIYSILQNDLDQIREFERTIRKMLI